MVAYPFYQHCKRFGVSALLTFNGFYHRAIFKVNLGEFEYQIHISLVQCKRQIDFIDRSIF